MWNYAYPPRKEKRYEIKMMGGYAACAMYHSHALGDWHSQTGKPKRNPYPPGRRHDEYERSYNNCDPTGDFHGRSY